MARFRKLEFSNPRIRPSKIDPKLTSLNNIR